MIISIHWINKSIELDISTGKEYLITSFKLELILEKYLKNLISLNNEIKLNKDIIYIDIA